MFSGKLTNPLKRLKALLFFRVELAADFLILAPKTSFVLKLKLSVVTKSGL
jgi:hypothetical protein